MRRCSLTLATLALVATASAAAWLTPGREASAADPFRHPAPLPALAPAPAATRNVLLVIGESLRFDDVCVDPAAPCRVTPFSHRAAPGRVPLLQMRASASTTAISLAVLWSGAPPTETGASVRTTPLLFDYAHAAGWDTGYFSSQPLMFTRSPEFFAALPISRRVAAKDLEPSPSGDTGASDALLSERAKRDLPLLHEPWFAVVQYTNTHYPYVTRGEEPFQPAKQSQAAEDGDAFRNHYRNSLYAQDRALGDLLTALRKTPAGARTVVLFTADHGEAFRDHGQLAHTTALYDEEVHVPAWVDAPPGTLTDAERAALDSARSALTWHVDVAPTVLDLVGVLDSSELAPQRRRMLGTSLLRTSRTSATVPLTNCAGIWSCSWENWGVMRGSRKLIARRDDRDWRCFDVLRDPKEEHDLGATGCADLAQQAASTFGKLPKDAAHAP